MSLELALAENTATMRELIAALANHNPAAGNPHAADAKPRAEKEVAAAPVEKPRAGAAVNTAAPATAPAATTVAASEATHAGSAEAPAAQSSTTAPANVSAAASYDDAKAAVLAVNKKLGREAALKILRKFGTEKLPEVDAARFGDVIAECDKTLGA